jgi:lipoprotein NlpI
MRIRSLALAAVLVALSFALSATAAEKPEEYILEATKAFQSGERDKAFEIAGKALAAYPKDARLHLLHGQLNGATAKHEEAIADYRKCLELDPKLADAHNLLGMEYFKLGKIAESVAAFDRYLELRPEAAPGHWQRGLSLYYAGKYEEGKKQFEGYEKVDTNDVENAVWHFLCAARKDGIDKARAGMLKIGKDKRLPMMEVYALFKGERKPADVLAAAQRDGLKDEERKQALFYAHLYLGLYYDVTGDKAKALEHMTQAAGKYHIGHYMGDVAHVHEELLRKEMNAK